MIALSVGAETCGSFNAYIAQKDPKLSAQTVPRIQSYLQGIVVGSVIKQIVVVARKGLAILKQSELL